jgi:hypothetical protein
VVGTEITPKGQDCVEHFDGDTSAYMQRKGGTTYNTYLPNAQGVIVGSQQHATQNNTSGAVPLAFIQLAGYVGQISEALSMPDSDRAELKRVAAALHAEAASGSPRPHRLRALADQVKDRLLTPGSTMAGQIGVQMVDQAIDSLP